MQRAYKKGEWRTFPGKRYYFRSKWEIHYAQYLEFLRRSQIVTDWSYESKTFWFEEIKRGVRSYKPDFQVFRPDGTHYWVEVKGYMDAKSATKLKRMRKYYPSEEIYIVDKAWFAKNLKVVKKILPKSSCGLDQYQQ